LVILLILVAALAAAAIVMHAPGRGTASQSIRAVHGSRD
jgi:hypothetical protein